MVTWKNRCRCIAYFIICITALWRLQLKAGINQRTSRSFLFGFKHRLHLFGLKNLWKVAFQTVTHTNNVGFEFATFQSKVQRSNDWSTRAPQSSSKFKISPISKGLVKIGPVVLLTFYSQTHSHIHTRTHTHMHTYTQRGGGEWERKGGGEGDVSAV